MTCREKLVKEHPEMVNSILSGGCAGCPHGMWPHIKKPTYCAPRINPEACYDCWDREYIETDSTNIEQNSIKDSGDRTEFSTGAVRDMREGKGRCDLMPLDVIAKFMNDDVIWNISEFQRTKEAHFLSSALDRVVPMFDDGYKPYTMLLEVAKHFEDGAKKYGEYNWQKGIPVKCYIDSAVRHYLKWRRGDNDEPHNRAFVWNILCCIWTVENKPEMME